MKEPTAWITQSNLLTIQRRRLAWVRVYSTDDGVSVPLYTWEQMQLAIIAEREACCTVVYDHSDNDTSAQRVVDAIRARGNA